MNTPDNLRCTWEGNGMRCQCPAAVSTSGFCVFHRHHHEVDCERVLVWSQDATPEAYDAAAREFTYRHPSPSVLRLRAQMERHRSGDSVLIASSKAFGPREPGDDEAEDPLQIELDGAMP